MQEVVDAGLFCRTGVANDIHQFSASKVVRAIKLPAANPMKFATALLICFGTAVSAMHAEDAAQRFKVLKEAYQAAKDRELIAVNEAYKKELAQLKEDFALAGDLDAALVVQAEMDGKEGTKGPARLITARENHDRIVERVLNNLKPAYIKALGDLRAELTRAGKLTEAVAVDTEMKAQVAATAPVAAGAGGNSAATPGVPANALIIEALIDGPSELRVQKDAIYWINTANAKPGRHTGKKEPTYVNGTAWQPEWGDQADRGTDKSKPYPLPTRLGSGQLDFKLISVSSKRGEVGIEQRDPIKAKGVGSEYSVLIPDALSGSRWYKFAVFLKGSR